MAMNIVRTIATLCAMLLIHGCALAASPADKGGVEASSRDEGVERDAIIDQASLALKRRDFAALDEMERHYLVSHAKTPSGTWKLATFHASLQYDLTEGLDREHGCAGDGLVAVGEWRRVNPDSPAAIISEAYLLNKQAWCIRGGGYAGDVPKSAWPRFSSGIDKAYQLLIAHKAQASADPEYYAVLATIARAKGLGRAAFQDIIKEATDREPYYLRFYAQAAFNFLPQWGGSFGELDDFARFAAEKTRTSEGSGFYARVYWSMFECRCANPADHPDWPMMQQGMRDAFKRFPVEFNAEYFRDLNCQHGDVDEAMQYIRFLTPKATSDEDRKVLILNCQTSQI